MKFTTQEIAKQPKYILYIPHGENLVILDGLDGLEMECVYDAMFAEKFFGGAK